VREKTPSPPAIWRAPSFYPHRSSPQSSLFERRFFGLSGYFSRQLRSPFFFSVRRVFDSAGVETVPFPFGRESQRTPRPAFPVQKSPTSVSGFKEYFSSRVRSLFYARPRWNSPNSLGRESPPKDLSPLSPGYSLLSPRSPPLYPHCLTIKCFDVPNFPSER